MAGYVARRLVEAVVLIIGAAALGFVLVHLAPGDPVAILAGERSSPEFQDRLRHELGLDQPLGTQLVKYLQHLAVGDLGYSFTYQAPVGTVILSRLQPTLLLMGASFVLSAIAGVWLGVWTAVRSRTWLATAVSALSVAGYSIPSFWLGQVLILVLGVGLGWFPILGMSSTYGQSGPAAWLDLLHHLFLPALTLMVFQLALISRLTRAAMLEVLEADYVRVARGKGLSERRVVYGHALRNALLPVVTVIGLQLGSLVAGFVLVETVFSWPGLGRLTFDAIAARDYPVISGLFLVISASVIVANLATDLIYPFIDPRIRYA